MTLYELYNHLKNPLNDSKTLSKLIEIYSIPKYPASDYYTNLVKCGEKKYINGEYLISDKDKFYTTMFNKWKNSIVNMTRDEFIKLRDQGSYDNDLIRIRNLLKNIPNATSKEQVDKVLELIYKDRELEKIMDKYYWDCLGFGSSWTHVYSRYLTAKKDAHINVEHRLYLNTESIHTFKVVNLFIEKCDQYKIPYYFKFDEFGDRDDTIVIYTSTEDLLSFISILKEIKKEHPELKDSFLKPPILLGCIDGWIGYGSEPKKTPSGQNQSFNGVRSKIIKESIDTLTKKWIMEHRYKKIAYKNKECTFEEYIAMRATEFYITKLNDRYNGLVKNKQRIAQNQNKIFDENVVINELGYTLDAINTDKFRESIYNYLKNRIKNDLTIACTDDYKKIESIKINFNNEKYDKIHGYDLQKTINATAINISRFDPNFNKSVLDEINKKAISCGIDVEKFCVDVHSKNRMIIVHKKNTGGYN